jgi:hypothetical protein
MKYVLAILLCLLALVISLVGIALGTVVCLGIITIPFGIAIMLGGFGLGAVCIMTANKLVET